MKYQVIRNTGLSPTQQADALRWMARQSLEIRVEIMMKRFNAYHQLKKEGRKMTGPVMDYCALLIACRQLGAEVRKEFHSSATLNDYATNLISRRRISKAREMSKPNHPKREQLARHWGRIVELRNAGISYRGIRDYLAKRHRLNVSHMTICKLWKEWETDT